MFQDAGEQPFSQSLALVRVVHDHVAEIAHRGFVGDDSRDADLLPLAIDAEAQRVLHTSPDGFGAAIGDLAADGGDLRIGGWIAMQEAPHERVLLDELEVVRDAGADQLLGRRTLDAA